jgi:hypothetical protein
MLRQGYCQSPVHAGRAFQAMLAYQPARDLQKTSMQTSHGPKPKSEPSPVQPQSTATGVTGVLLKLVPARYQVVYNGSGQQASLPHLFTVMLSNSSQYIRKTVSEQSRADRVQYQPISTVVGWLLLLHTACPKTPQLRNQQKPLSMQSFCT